MGMFGSLSPLVFGVESIHWRLTALDASTSLWVDGVTTYTRAYFRIFRISGDLWRFPPMLHFVFAEGTTNVSSPIKALIAQSPRSTILIEPWTMWYHGLVLWYHCRIIAGTSLELLRSMISSTLGIVVHDCLRAGPESDTRYSATACRLDHTTTLLTVLGVLFWHAKGSESAL